jgi:23S rRNA (cytidine1920-2'-O)/16S rRNA (cytidine1409-2'-O)-methyltransferase
MIAAGRVAIAGQTAAKSATQVSREAPVTVAAPDDGEPEYVSRGGHKLAGALAAFGDLDVTGKRCLDAGASTGGFTDVLLRSGAAHVVAVDVGYGQLAWKLRTDERVTVLDRVNVRALEAEQVAPPPGLVVGDLSFISLALVLPALVTCAADDADFVLMVKPQFEVGRERVGSGGVVRDKEARADAVRQVAATATGLGLGVRGITASPLPGPSGNVEYFLWLRRGWPPLDEEALRHAIETGPQLFPGRTIPVPPVAISRGDGPRSRAAAPDGKAKSRERAVGGVHGGGMAGERISCTRWVIHSGPCWCWRTLARRTHCAARGWWRVGCSRPG